jgi:hypothetical protein
MESGLIRRIKKAFGLKVPTLWESEVASRGHSEEFKEFIYSLSSVAWKNNGYPIHQIAPRTFANGKKDNYPNSAYFAFQTEKDAMNFRQDGIDILDKVYGIEGNNSPVAGIWTREQEDIGSNLVKPILLK